MPSCVGLGAQALQRLGRGLRGLEVEGEHHLIAAGGLLHAAGSDGDREIADLALKPCSSLRKPGLVGVFLAR